MHRPQTFDRDGNMAGKQNGASNQFKEITSNQKPVYSVFNITASQSSVTDDLRGLASKNLNSINCSLYISFELHICFSSFM